MAALTNPYREAHARIRARQGGQWAALLPLIAAGAATPLARPVLLGFLDAGGVDPAGVEAITFRLGGLIAAAVAMHTYADLVRGPDRAVLDPHPVQARALLAAIAVRTARERLYLPGMAAILLLPLGLEGGDWRAWAGASAVSLGAWLGALGVGFAIHLGAVWAAINPALAGVLEALRGSNPRMQAAFIYAPGVALAAVGLAVGLASAGLAGALQGWLWGWAFLLLPPALGALAWASVGVLADGYYVRATALLSEIDAQWASVEAADEAASAGRVYLDWLAGAHRPELLRALRQGWRRLRLWATGAWGVGALGALAGWSEAPTAPALALTVVGAGVLLVAALPTRMAEGDPPWLDQALNLSGSRVAVARAAVAWLYAQGALLPAVASLLLRQGLSVAGEIFLLAQGMAVLGSALAAVAALRWRGRGAWLYGPLALLLWALIVGRTP